MASFKWAWNGPEMIDRSQKSNFITDVWLKTWGDTKSCMYNVITVNRQRSVLSRTINGNCVKWTLNTWGKAETLMNGITCMTLQEYRKETLAKTTAQGRRTLGDLSSFHLLKVLLVLYWTSVIYKEIPVQSTKYLYYSELVSWEFHQGGLIWQWKTSTGWEQYWIQMLITTLCWCLSRKVFPVVYFIYGYIISAICTCCNKKLFD